MSTTTTSINKQVSDYKDHDHGTPVLSIAKLLVFLVVVGAIAGIVYLLNTYDPAVDLLSRYGHWWGEALLVFAALLYITLHKGTRQPPLEFVVSDDPRVLPVSDLVKNEETALYVDCAVLSRNIYVQGEPMESYPYAAFANGSLKDSRIETDWELIHRVRDKNEKGLLIELYKHDRIKVYNQGNEARTTYAIVFRGTVGLNSWMSNAHWLFKWLPFQDQYDQLKYIVPELVREINERHPYESEYNIITTGHSLGGGLAQHACYLDEKIKTAYVFNSSPVTGFTDVSKDLRDKTTKDVRIHRLYERGEILENFRFFMKIVYLFKPTPNKDPYLSEHRFDFERAGLITEHGMQPIALALCYLKDNPDNLDVTEGKYKMIKDVLSPKAGMEARGDVLNEEVENYLKEKKEGGIQRQKDEKRRMDENRGKE